MGVAGHEAEVQAAAGQVTGFNRDIAPVVGGGRRRTAPRVRTATVVVGLIVLVVAGRVVVVAPARVVVGAAGAVVVVPTTVVAGTDPGSA